MPSIERTIRDHNFFLRRRDLLALGYSDADLRVAREEHRIFRVRQGWYSVPDAPDHAIRAVRVGGRVTSLSALECFGLPVPRQPNLHVAVRSTASRLRSPNDRRMPLGRNDRVILHWLDDDRVGGMPWCVTLEEALSAVLITERLDVAVACFSAALRRRMLTDSRIDRIFASAPARVQGFRRLISRYDESHGETYFRLRTIAADLHCEQQVEIPGVGRFDFKLAPHTFVEIDGAQHDPSWTGETSSTWEKDLDRDAAMAILGNRVLHFGYRQLYTDWATVLAAIERAISDDDQLEAGRRKHPYRPPTKRKRRRNRDKEPQ